MGRDKNGQTKRSVRGGVCRVQFSPRTQPSGSDDFYRRSSVTMTNNIAAVAAFMCWVAAAVSTGAVREERGHSPAPGSAPQNSHFIGLPLPFPSSQPVVSPFRIEDP